jgi:hypothetical protein
MLHRAARRSLCAAAKALIAGRNKTILNRGAGRRREQAPNNEAAREDPLERVS